MKTIRHGLVAVAACALAAAVPGGAKPAVGQVEWSIERDGSSADASRIQLTVETRWTSNSHGMWSNDRPISDL